MTKPKISTSKYLKIEATERKVVRQLTEAIEKVLDNEVVITNYSFQNEDIPWHYRVDRDKKHTRIIIDYEE